jgi:hypothetical protein
MLNRINPDDSDLKFYGKDSREGDMAFESDVIVHLPFKKPENLNDVLKSEDARNQLNLAALAQVQHIFGALTTHPNYQKHPAVIANDYKLDLLSVSNLPAKSEINLRYRYIDRIALHKALVPEGTQVGGEFQLKFILPKDPQKIYSQGFESNGSTNLCTDRHYNSEGDFWYFWNPFQKNCPLNEQTLQSVTARVKLRPSTTKTLPEYDRLYGDNQNGKNLKAVVMFGIDENFNSGDLGRTSYTNFINLLLQNGFDKTTNDAKHKVFKFPDRRSFELELHVWLLEPGSEEFDKVAIDALEGQGSDGGDSADILIYDGHSGLGGFFSPDHFAEILGRPLRLPKNKYQIFAFQGCSTYAYYNKIYFDLKKSSRDRNGSKNLDIITAGIGLDFSVGAKQDFEIISRLLNGKRQSWQTIVNALYNASPELSAIHQINGDEDNGG